MERKVFIEHLLNIAFASMVCDGDIDPKEEQYLQDIEKHDFYLKEFDMSDRLSKLMSDWELNGLKLCDRILNSMYKVEFLEDQKIVILDFAIGIVRADDVMQQAEIEFVNTLIRNIKMSSELVDLRYGNWSVIEQHGQT
jgi:uncharacterized tellurite resistance protein B-like protein